MGESGEEEGEGFVCTLCDSRQGQGCLYSGASVCLHLDELVFQGPLGRACCDSFPPLSAWIRLHLSPVPRSWFKQRLLGWQLSYLPRTPFTGSSQETMQPRREQPLPITGALAGGGVILTFLFWINISWALTLPGTQLRSYQASGLAARALLLPQTRASRHSCLAHPMGQLVAPRLAGLMSLPPFSPCYSPAQGTPFAHCGTPVSYAGYLPHSAEVAPFPIPPTLSLQTLH